jgi:hypothetical protein
LKRREDYKQRLEEKQRLDTGLRLPDVEMPQQWLPRRWMNGQFIIMLPDKNAVIAITANISAMQKELNQVWEYIYLPFDHSEKCG